MGRVRRDRVSVGGLTRLGTELSAVINRVRRAFGGLVAALGSPTRAVRSRGKAPGRRVGECPGPRERHPVVRRRPKLAARRRKRAA